LDHLLAVTAQLAIPEIVRQNEDQIGLLRGGRRTRASTSAALKILFVITLLLPR
jgi:hypothetical protein